MSRKVLMFVLDRQVLGLFTKNSLGGETLVVLGGLPIYLTLFWWRNTGSLRRSSHLSDFILKLHI